MQTLRDLLNEKDKSREKSEAIVIPNGPRLSYPQLHSVVVDVAQNLAKMGINKHCFVSSSLTNGVEFVSIFLATTWMRCAAAPLNPNYAIQEVEFYLEDLKSTAIIVHAGKAGFFLPVCQKHGIMIIEAAWHAPSSKMQLKLLYSPKPEKTASLDLQPHPEDVALVLHTSGTTSRPKAVPLTHKNLVASIKNISSCFSLTPNHTTLIVMPLFHVHGLIGAMLTTLFTGGRCVIPPRFSASAFWPLFIQERCNWFSAVPTILQILLAHQQSSNAPSSFGNLQFIRSCSSSLPATVHKQLEDTFHVPVVESYAMTEASHQMTSNYLPSKGQRKAGSVGQAQGQVRISVRDEKGQEIKEVGKVGEVCVTGDNVTNGYLNNEAANSTSYFEGGWFRTGDQGYLDKDGFLFLTGRLKELINRGGEKISPIEVDDVLLSCDGVKEAVCFGVDDAMYGQEVWAAVILKPDSRFSSMPPEKIVQVLQSECKKKIVAFKVPKKIFITQELPKTSTGKIQRRHVASHFLQLSKTSSIKAKL